MRWVPITGDGTSIREAIARIDRTGGRGVVVDGQNRPAEAVPSEQLRTALFEGATPDAPVSSIVDGTAEPDVELESNADAGLEGVTDGTIREAPMEIEAERASEPDGRAVETVLVVGGAGYVGSVLCRKLLEDGFTVRVLDPLMYGNGGIAALEGRDRFALYRGDARSVDDVLEAIEGVDAVVHLGGIVGDPATALDPRKTLEYNLHSTQLLASICKYHGLNRFLFASTCSVYGRTDGAGRCTEDDPLNPVSLYARAKIQSERALRELADERFAPTVLRMATVYGYSPRMRFDLVGNVLPAKAHEKGVVPVFGGDQYRPNVHVEDVARAYQACLTAPFEDVAGETFNVGSNEQNYRIDELATVVADAFPEAEIEYHDDRTDERSYRVEFEKLRSRLGFEPTRTIRDHCLELRAAFEADAFGATTATKYSNCATLESAPSYEETDAVIESGEPPVLEERDESTPLEAEIGERRSGGTR
ncbi:NAD-dependent epimerase/dehydratase family protein [Natronococcus sp. A-GB7]|uniref:NAD-dependent epimerase/dehydratase family protein n=1 Tax=Natronococcus sp. A-GB7 TaxID=3037649 RepID=UPI00241E79C4|nr:NAD-dependent epimerase/dehydratase family protein [Natronococcus sp. A-GB7]MDG5820941.1 NAD-dependent epimerase/dehydratase family protein [Natronococcus sp. A-GB7]